MRRSVLANRANTPPRGLTCEPGGEALARPYSYGRPCLLASNAPFAPRVPQPWTPPALGDAASATASPVSSPASTQRPVGTASSARTATASSWRALGCTGLSWGPRVVLDGTPAPCSSLPVPVSVMTAGCTQCPPRVSSAVKPWPRAAGSRPCPPRGCIGRLPEGDPYCVTTYKSQCVGRGGLLSTGAEHGVTAACGRGACIQQRTSARLRSFS